MYEETHYPVSAEVIERHDEAWRLIAAPGAFWNGAERVQIVAEARAATACMLCERRKAALSPFAVDGEHDSVSDLPPVLIDMIHRMRTDPGAATRARCSTAFSRLASPVSATSKP